MIDALPIPAKYLKHAHKLARYPIVRRIARAVTTSSTHDEWLFVIGCYDSGTTLFHELLAQHRDIASLPGEGAFITGELHTPEDFGSVRLIWPVESEIEAADAEADERILRDEWGIFLSNKKKLALEKSISDLARLEQLATTFPKARFVSIVRDGRAAAEGIRRRAGAGAYALPDGKERHTMAECAEQWVYAQRKIEAFQSSIDPGRFMATSYEAFCEDASGVLNEVVAFAGLEPYSPELPEIQNRNDSSISRIAASDLEQFLAVAGDTMRTYGYLT